MNCLKMSDDTNEPLGILYSRINRRPVATRDSFYRLKQYLFALPYWIAAHWLRTPGLFFQTFIIKCAIKLWFAGAGNSAGYHQMVTLPMDSVRYFEFDFMWRSVAGMKTGQRYLDISSPRLFPLMLLQSDPELSADLANPDLRDLEVTRELFKNCGFSDRCSFHGDMVCDLDFLPESFDIITCISVVEHIPGIGDLQAVEKMWQLLKPGGKLLLSVPCAAQAFEEYVDYDEYQLLEVDGEDFVFGQRFYNDDLLKARVFSVTAPPKRIEVYGEKRPGFCITNRQAKVNDPNYPFWREPYMTGEQFAYFDAIDKLPGWGVVAMEFCKPL